MGCRENGSPEYDLYELLAFWNKDTKYNGKQ